MNIFGKELESVKQVVQESELEESGVEVTVKTLEKSFGERQVLKGINLEIEPGQFVAIIGRSGCGKSTLLRLIAGLDEPTQGSIRLNQNLLPGSDNSRIMFQEARLLPWKNVLENVALGLKEGGEADAQKVLAAVGLSDRSQEWPASLSGGQKQRVALARALVHHPRLLLLDEPLGALDALTRIEMHQLIESLWEKNQFTALLVTHDVSEAIALADRVILIDEGSISLDLKIDLPRPRTKTSGKFAEIEDLLLGHLLKRP